MNKMLIIAGGLMLSVIAGCASVDSTGPEKNQLVDIFMS
jgi:hypothetical protein